MATDTTIYRGEDKELTITVNDSTGTAIDISAYAGILCIIKSKGGQIIEQFSREALLNYNDTDFVQQTQSGATLGQFIVRLQSAKTINAVEGYFEIEVKLQATDANYTGSSKFDIMRQAYDTEGKRLLIQDSHTKDISALL